MRSTTKLLKDRRIQALIGANVAIVLASAAFIAVMGPSLFNFLLVMSGWTSIGALAMADYLGIKAVQTDIAISQLGGIERVLKFVDGAEQLLSSPEFMALFRLLPPIPPETLTSAQIKEKLEKEKEYVVI